MSCRFSHAVRLFMPRLKLMTNLAQQKVFKQVYNAKMQPSFMPNGSLLFIPLS